MSKKDKSKFMQGEDGKSAKIEGDACWLQLPREAYERYRRDHPTDTRRTNFWRYIFSLVDPEDTRVYGFEHINVLPRGSVSAQCADADDDDDCGQEPIKLCDEGGRGPAAS